MLQYAREEKRQKAENEMKNTRCIHRKHTLGSRASNISSTHTLHSLGLNKWHQKNELAVEIYIS